MHSYKLEVRMAESHELRQAMRKPLAALAEVGVAADQPQRIVYTLTMAHKINRPRSRVQMRDEIADAGGKISMNEVHHHLTNV